MQARLFVWVKSVGQKLKKYWWVWFISITSYVLRSLLEDRAAGTANTWLDNHAPDVAKFVRENMSFFPQSELGVVGWLFVLTVLGIMIWAYVDTRETREVISFPASPQDDANREKIKSLFCSFGHPAYADLLQLTNRFSERLHRQGLEKEMIATLAGNLAFAPCNHASGAMTNVLKGPDKDNINVLQQRLREFVRAYRNHVRWMHLIAPFSSPPLNEDPGYREWHEKHRLFRQELRVITVPDDFLQLREEIGGGWQDTLELM